MNSLLLLPLLLAVVSADFELHVLHTNDVHARFEEMNKYGGYCTDKANCFGGMARLNSMIKKLRTDHPNNILVDGGDYFQGTIWFHYYKGYAAAHFMKKMKYDGMAAGNHEFDNGPSNTAAFAKNLTSTANGQHAFPFLSVNMKFAEGENLLSPYVKKSTVKEVGGQKIGIIGYTTPETEEISRVGGHITFDPIVPALRAEAQRLKADEGVNKVVAIGHAGYLADKAVATEVLEVDVVVGGHTDTFLYTGEPPSSEKKEGPYPTVITRADGSKALVVQDYTFAKYLGHLKVVFDDEGNVKSWGGNPVLLDNTVVPDPAIQKDLEAWMAPLKEFSEVKIGRTFVHLSRKMCRVQECNMGNLITDALVFENLNHADSEKWADAPIAMMNSGGIRADIVKGEISIAQVMAVMPFRNTVDIITITGATIKKMLEHGMTEREKKPGRFLQFSGLRVWFNETRAEKSRVVKVLARCYQCATPGYSALNETAEYRVIVPQYLISGGDGYSFLADLIIKRHKIGNVDSDMVIQHIHTGDEQLNTLAYGTEMRINFAIDPLVKFP